MSRTDWDHEQQTYQGRETDAPEGFDADEYQQWLWETRPDLEERVEPEPTGCVDVSELPF